MSKLSLNALRDVLWEGIENLQASGLDTAAVINAASNASGKIVSSAVAQMKYAQLHGKTPNIDIMKSWDDDGEAPGLKAA